jgi:feruloyl esterase
MAPGVEHCAGGPGPDAFGQLGIVAASGPKYGLFDALEAWVEKGVPAGDVVATKSETGSNGEIKVKMTRPLCPYPEVVKYKGTGDANDSANFLCAAE